VNCKFITFLNPNHFLLLEPVRMNKAEKLRELFRKPGFFRLIGAHNGLTARLGERAGFEGIWASSLEMSASHAVPDANVLTMTDYLDMAISMNDVVSIPVVVDVDQGYGNSTNVIRMVKKFEKAGVAGVMMEDKLFPKQNSLLADGRQELAPIAEFVGKIMAAKNAQKTEEFMVMARLEALIAGWGQEEAMKRAKAYVKAGADAIMIHSKNEDPKEVIDFVTSWKEDVPLVIVPTTYYNFTEDKIRQYSQIKMVIYANHGIRTIVKSVSETFNEISKNGGTHTVVPKIAPVKEVFELQDTFVMKEEEKKFLKTGKEIKAIIPAAGGSSYTPLFKDLLQDRPLTMLDINGKSILQRTVEILNKCGIRDINVITGYKEEAINVEGIKLIHNREYKQKSILHSIIEGLENVDGDTLLVYADIVFDKSIIDRLLTCEKDINLAIDISYREENYDKVYDLVVAKRSPTKGKGVLSCGKENPILKIGRNVKRGEATHEFFGILFLSQKGLKTIKKEFSIMKEKASKINGIDIDKADFSDFLQELINKRIQIDSMEVSKGWTEIHTFDDYKKVCEMLSN